MSFLSSIYNFNVSNRFNILTGDESEDGMIFVNSISNFENISDTKLIYKGVDTIKARFNGTLRFSFIQKIIKTLDNGGFNPIFSLDDTDFILSRGSKATRYRFKLQAKALGVIIHFGDLHIREENICEPEKGKIKYEFSPNFIYDNGLECVSLFMSNFNQLMMHGFTPSGVDVHLCADLQGWKPDDDIIKNMVTFVRKPPSVYHGIDSLSYNYESSAVSYGLIDTITWGSASSSQLSIYNKTKEAKVHGKSKFWHYVYDNETVLYNPDDEVYRVELRLPSSVIKNLVKRDDGSPMSILSVEDLQNHLNQLWVYGLSRLFRYDYDTSKTKKKTIKPIWQFLLDDVRFNDVYEPCDFKRQYIVVDDSIDHNISLAIGNLTSAFAKAGYSVDEVVETVQKMPIYRQILDYASEKKNMGEGAYLAWIIDVFKHKKIEFDESVRVSKDKFRKYRRFYLSSRDYSNFDNELYCY